ncbi:odorant receptor 22c-like [Formica exsecta]|uniref:odorant receptor 22c-like n=1 Tax=Formica exsecta TaxID=72781 RepID=UPI001142E0DD|nr:odorant receptor 22c-like [Formica exsecta]
MCKIILKMFESVMCPIDSRFAFMVNKKFRFIITVQFVVSMLVVCFNLHQLTQMDINAKYIQIMLYMCCMLTQISFYCWYGNEVKLKSQQLASNVFEMEWITLDHNVKRSLLIIMTRSMIPIEFTSAYVISMNLESFVGVNAGLSDKNIKVTVGEYKYYYYCRQQILTDLWINFQVENLSGHKEEEEISYGYNLI